MSNLCVAYYRVSTSRQGESELGLAAQRATVRRYTTDKSLILLEEHTEIESGRKTVRPKLGEAIKTCNETGAALLIAKLDRLARNVHFIAGLLESNVDFVAIDMPNADRFMLHIYAAMAEEEGRRISERTKSALSAARAKGVVLGRYGKKLAEQNKSAANIFAKKMGPKILSFKNQGLSIREISDRLNHAGSLSFHSKKWHPTTVQRVLKRYEFISSG